MNAEFSPSDIATAERTITLWRLTYEQEQRILRRIGRAVIKQAKQNVRDQREVNGKAFAPRKRKSRKKMLTKLPRLLKSRNKPNSVDIGFQNNLVGNIAYKQQKGRPPEKWNGARMLKSRGAEPDYDAKATPRQARLLIKSGFTLKKKRGEGRKRPSTKWITENLKQGQLFAILRKITGDESSSRWEIVSAPREFLGLTRQQSNQIIVREIKREIGE